MGAKLPAQAPDEGEGRSPAYSVALNQRIVPTLAGQTAFFGAATKIEGRLSTVGHTILA